MQSDAPAGELLAVVVLTKDEESNLSQCLKSVEGWVDEVFVVDSGSTDQTLGIARGFTDKTECPRPTVLLLVHHARALAEGSATCC